jgi:hypothetical protein
MMIPSLEFVPAARAAAISLKPPKQLEKPKSDRGH